MAKVSLKLPVGVTYPDPQSEMEIEAATVGEALATAIAREPRLGERIYRENGKPAVGIFLNGRNIRQLQGEETPLGDGDKLMLVPPISGG
jgi:molybdopterin synthase sulfur carrier subunit